MIIGVGTDIVQMPRISRIFSIYKECFAKRILSRKEFERFYTLNEEGKINFLSKRFAAKEAVSKAFGLGIGRGISFCDITILNDDLGKPTAHISSSCIKGNFDVYLSISDDPPVCIAFAVVSKAHMVEKVNC